MEGEVEEMNRATFRAPASLLHRTVRQCYNEPNCLFCWVRAYYSILRYHRQILQLKRLGFDRRWGTARTNTGE